MEEDSQEHPDWVVKWENASKSILTKNTRFASISVFNPELVEENLIRK